MDRQVRSESTYRLRYPSSQFQLGLNILYFWGQRYPVHYGDRILRVLDYIVTISCGLCVFCAVVVLTGFEMCGCVYVWTL